MPSNLVALLGFKKTAKKLRAPEAVRYAYAFVRAFHLAIFALYIGTVLSEPSDLSMSIVWGGLVLSALSQIFVVNVIGHRFIGHNSFRPSRNAQFMLLLWTIFAGLSSPLSSALLHRRHHRYPDSERDPHSPPPTFSTPGLRFVAVVYFNFFHEKNFSFSDVFRESRRPFFIFFHRYGAILSLAMSAVLFATVGLEGLFFLQTLPVLVCFVGQFNLVNLTHVEDEDRPGEMRSVDSICANLLTLGEGAHNSHHRAPRQVFYPSDHFLMFDLTGYIVQSIWKK